MGNKIAAWLVNILLVICALLFLASIGLVIFTEINPVKAMVPPLVLTMILMFTRKQYLSKE